LGEGRIRENSWGSPGGTIFGGAFRNRTHPKDSSNKVRNQRIYLIKPLNHQRKMIQMEGRVNK